MELHHSSESFTPAKERLWKWHPFIDPFGNAFSYCLKKGEAEGELTLTIRDNDLYEFYTAKSFYAYFSPENYVVFWENVFRDERYKFFARPNHFIFTGATVKSDVPLAPALVDAVAEKTNILKRLLNQ